MAAVSSHERGVTVSILARPRASRTAIVSEQDGWLKLRVAAPPVDGAANAEIVGWLAKQLRVPKSRIEFLSGEHSRKKVVLVPDVSVADVMAALGLV